MWAKQFYDDIITPAIAAEYWRTYEHTASSHFRALGVPPNPAIAVHQLLTIQPVFNLPSTLRRQWVPPTPLQPPQTAGNPGNDLPPHPDRHRSQQDRNPGGRPPAHGGRGRGRGRGDPRAHTPGDPSTEPITNPNGPPANYAAFWERLGRGRGTNTGRVLGRVQLNAMGALQLLGLPPTECLNYHIRGRCAAHGCNRGHTHTQHSNPAAAATLLGKLQASLPQS